MGIYCERTPSRAEGIAVIAVAFLLIHALGVSPLRELFRDEMLFAAAASSPAAFPNAVIHGVPSPQVMPLFPAAARLLHLLTGLSIVAALRLLSLAMLGATAVVVYFAAVGGRSRTAGFAAAAMYLSTILSVEKGFNGTPITTGAFFLLCAQMSFFHFGLRHYEWDRAWIISGLLILAGFLTEGFPVIFFFAAPLCFFRRPLSVRSKFRKPGFVVAVVLVAATLLWWLHGLVPQGIINPEFIDWSRFSFSRYLLELICFLPELTLRMLPWSLIAWIPFCVALQALDSTPLLGRYLLTLFWVTLGALWLLPFIPPEYIFYLLGPLAILVGRTYELALRRYGRILRRVLAAAPLTALAMILCIALAGFAPDTLLAKIVSLHHSLGFRSQPSFLVIAPAAALLLAALTVYLRFGIRSEPMWMMLLGTAVAIGIFHSAVMLPYQAQERDKRDFGGAVRSALAGVPADERRIFTLKVRDLYGGLFYSGVPVISLRSTAELPQSESPTVYLLSPDFPNAPERGWSNLLPLNFSYRKHKINLWRGVWRQRETGSADPLLENLKDDPGPLSRNGNSDTTDSTKPQY